jgi:phthiocerol/phenolphthiocerol synthesis type-I polyketide synthase E
MTAPTAAARPSISASKQPPGGRAPGRGGKNVADESEDLGQIAIIGLAGRFPGADDVRDFWANLAQGREGITALGDDELLAAGVSPALLRDPDYVKAKGVLAGADLFDAGFFGYSPREAEIMDPQQRVLLECAWQALESAGCDPRAFDGRIGVFAGASLNSYLLFNLLASQAADAAGAYQTLIASDKDFLATRISYKLGLTGPGVTVQSACSTSLTAVHLACQSLLDGECDIALAGGVSVSVPLTGGYRYEPGGILSPDGHCRAFDSAAAGTVAGNGAGLVVLRRLAEARRHRDAIAAVIRGSAINNDGSLKAGYTAPSVNGQAAVIAEALAVADVEPASIGYIETHGTGTTLGDPIEIAALTHAFREHTSEVGFCAIGSVKSSVGHLDAAAGVTGLIKAVLALQNEAIPPTLNYEHPNPGLNLETSPFFVNTKLRPWPRQQAPRRAGVSSFGIGGTNVHMIVEEAPADPPASGPAGPEAGTAHLLPLSAKTAPALAAYAALLADHLDRDPGADLADTAYTLAARRRPFEHRASVVCRNREGAVAALRRVQRAGNAGRTARPQASAAFLFPGQGTQYPGMARGLYQREPVFTAELDRCAGLFARWLGTDVRTLLFPPPGQADEAEQALQETAITQPVVFMVEYALAQLWCSWGIQPRAMAGHSIGEYTAACLAGVFSLEDAARLVAARGRLVQDMPRGAMLAVALPEAEMTGWLGAGAGGGLCLAAANSPQSSVVSGPAEAIGGLHERLTAAGVACRMLHTSHAFHSPSMDGAVRPFTEEASTAALSAPQIPFCSNVTGTWITDEQATSPGYWGAHLRQAVRFADCLGELLSDPDLVLVEVGPGQTLATFARQHGAWSGDRMVTGSLRHPKERHEDQEYLLRSLGDLWNAGVPADWAALCQGGNRRVARLPGYAFQRQRYWVTPGPAAGGQQPEVTAKPAGDMFYADGWTRLPTRPDGVNSPRDAAWAVLGDELSLGRELAGELGAEGAAVTEVRAGCPAGPPDVAGREHYARLVKELDAGGPPLIRIVHLRSLDGGPAGPLDEARLDRARTAGMDSLLALAQGILDARPSAPVAIDVVCQGIYSVTGEEVLRPENATLLGPCTVIPQEIPDVTCRLLDITGTDVDAPAPETVRALRAILAGDAAGERELALRGRHWWARGFDAVELGRGGSPRLRDGGVYLITGGLGGIGLELAEHIARQVAGPVLGLLSRSAFPAEDEWARWPGVHDPADPVATRIQRLRRLQELGARVVVLQGDVTDRRQANRAVGELRARCGPVNGVIHAAGVPSRGLIAGKGAQDVADVLAAKTRGTLILDEVCGGDADFILLCSSLTAVLGGPGQADYCAANAFLDTFAQWKRRETGAPVSAVAWDTWRGVGMAAGAAALLGRAGGPATEGHPLLQRLVSASAESRTYATAFSPADSWIVDEHRIQGHGLVPGTAYLELVRAAVAGQAGGRAIELRDVQFTMPVIVPDGETREVFTTIGQHDGQLRFTVHSRVGTGRQEHASGTIAFPGRDEDERATRDLEAMRRECEITEVISTEDELKRRLGLDRVERGGWMRFTFGPRWRCLRRIETGAHRLMVTLQLDDAFLGDIGSYALHPALLDVAGAAARIHARDTYYLPFSYRSVRILSPLTPTVYVRVALNTSGQSTGETLTCDMELYDPQGRPLVLITGFTIKRINDSAGMITQIERSVAAPPPDGPGGPGGPATASTLAVLSEGMSAEDGAAAFGRILAAPSLPDQIMVAARDLTTLRGIARSITPALLAREAEQFTPAGGIHPRPELDTPYVAPVTDEENAIAAVWAEVLGIDQVGRDDDFFALGGHSLAAVQIGGKIQARFDVRLELADFFDHPTVANTAALLTTARSRSADNGPDQITAVPGVAAEELAELDALSEQELDARLRELLAADTEDHGGME